MDREILNSSVILTVCVRCSTVVHCIMDHNWGAVDTTANIEMLERTFITSNTAFVINPALISYTV